MSDEIKKEPVVESKAPEELSAEELNNVNGGGFLQTLGQVISDAQAGGATKQEILNVKLTETFISSM